MSDPTNDPLASGPVAGTSHNSAFSVLSFREELRTMPAFHRGSIYFVLTLLALVVIQSAVIMPYILIRFGWGYNVG